MVESVMVWFEQSVMVWFSKEMEWNGMDGMDEAMMKHFTCTSPTHEYKGDDHCM